MIVISNSSPLVSLAGIGQLDLFHQLYGQIIIPSAVYHEIVIRGAGQPGATEIQNSPWIEVKSVTNQQMVTMLTIDVDVGEAEAIVLAVELNADLLLLDERKGRLVASHLGVKLTGVY